LVTERLQRGVQQTDNVTLIIDQEDAGCGHSEFESAFYLPLILSMTTLLICFCGPKFIS
jgi:hypothetical protein